MIENQTMFALRTLAGRQAALTPDRFEPSYTFALYNGVAPIWHHTEFDDPFASGYAISWKSMKALDNFIQARVMSGEHLDYETLVVLGREDPINMSETDLELALMYAQMAGAYKHSPEILGAVIGGMRSDPDTDSTSWRPPEILDPASR